MGKYKGFKITYIIIIVLCTINAILAFFKVAETSNFVVGLLWLHLVLTSVIRIMVINLKEMTERSEE